VVAQPGHPLSLKFGELAAAVVREVLPRNKGGEEGRGRGVEEV
jgi:hypothetical protein